MNQRIRAATGLGLALAAGIASFAPADEPQTKGGRPSPGRERVQTKSSPPRAFPDLTKGLKETPGCLGVETARTGSGKSLIFAWFKDRKAAEAWYRGDMHRALMRGMPDVTPTNRPMKNIKDDGRPILVIASITFAPKPELEGIDLPIRQIAVEMYQPVDGGLSMGGRFAPEAMEVPGIKDYTPKK